MKYESQIDGLIPDLKKLYRNEKTDAPENTLDDAPRQEHVFAALKLFIDVLLPGRIFHSAEKDLSLEDRLRQGLRTACGILLPELRRALPYRALAESAQRRDPVAAKEKSGPQTAEEVLRAFLAGIPSMRASVIQDVKAAYRGDPAILSYAEAMLACPGILAVVSHRIAHEFYRCEVPIIPRIMAERTHSQTGIDIHPGAEIGSGLFIDHGTGVVIGETARIGNNVKMYQGAILGAKSFALDASGNPLKGTKRHPTVEDNVVIYSNATILGGDTVIGRGSTIGGSVFLTKSVPPNSLVVNPPPKLEIKSESKLDYEI